MNKNGVIASLVRAIGALLYHNLFLDELIGLISGSGYEPRFFTLFVVRLRQLAALGVRATDLEEFENLGGGLYSMHLSGRGFNIRLLYSFLPNREPVFLLAFYERGGKKNTDYTPYIEPAKDRLDYMKEVFKNEPFKL